MQIPIFFSFDNNYVEPAAVAIFSLLNSAKKNNNYDLYVLHSNIESPKQNILKKIVKSFENAKITFIDTHGFLDKYFYEFNFSNSFAKSKFTPDTLARCFASRFFPNLDKIIYSDVDVIFTDDISELYLKDMQDNYFYGVKNAFMKWDKSELSHLSKENFEDLKDSYISGGIFLINLKQIRNDDIEKQMIKIIEDKSILKKWNDQDVINLACKGKIGFIPLNYISYPYLIDYLNIKNFNSHYSKEELFDSIINPKIIHFAAEKPWNGSPNYSNLWWTIFNYLNLKTPPAFSNKKYIKDKETYLKYKKYKFLYKLILFILGISILKDIVFFSKFF